jgi:hypothetical protein
MVKLLPAMTEVGATENPVTPGGTVSVTGFKAAEASVCPE